MRGRIVGINWGGKVGMGIIIGPLVIKHYNDAEEWGLIIEL